MAALLADLPGVEEPEKAPDRQWITYWNSISNHQ